MAALRAAPEAAERTKKAATAAPKAAYLLFLLNYVILVSFRVGLGVSGHGLSFR
jgi:hypothetical protein